jgi:hypothetical protein
MARLALAFVFLSLWLCLRAEAQIDPSSVLLLNQDPRPSTKDNGLDSGRYIVKPKAGAGVDAHGATTMPSGTHVQRKDERRRTSAGADEREIRPYHETHPAGSTSTSPAVGPGDATTGEPKPNVNMNTNTNTNAIGVNNSSAGVRSDSTKIISSGAEGGDARPDEAAQHLEGRRLNILELDIAPMFLYNDARSEYWFRDYQTVGPGFSAEARVWLNPSFGLQTSYASTLSGHISDSHTGARNVAATHQWLSAGIRSRRFLTAARQSPVLTFGLDFQEYQFRVPSDAQLHGRLRTMGAKLVLESEWPTSDTYSWLVGFSILPKAQHKEVATDLDLRSGANVETNSIGLSLGGRVTFNRSNAVFFKISQNVEKNIFTGAAGTADPRTGVAPTGVAVLNSFTMLQLGYSWGK